MKKLILLFAVASLFSSCATILCGKNTCTKENRKVRVGMVVCDVACGFLPLAVDVADGCIYKCK